MFTLQPKLKYTLEGRCSEGEAKGGTAGAAAAVAIALTVTEDSVAQDATVSRAFYFYGMGYPVG